MYGQVGRHVMRHASLGRTAVFLTTTTSAVTALLLFVGTQDKNDKCHDDTLSLQQFLTATQCEAPSSSSSSSLPPSTTTTRTKEDVGIVANPNWIRRALYRIGVIRRLPLPRRVRPHDPDLTVSSRLLRQRARDALEITKLQQALATAVAQRDTTTAQTLVTAVYELLYGRGVTPQTRTEFLIRFGCTAWNAQILQSLTTTWGHDRGFVEIGAGHGQWARALQEYRQQQQQSSSILHPQTFVRAYDNASHLPLNPQIYHARTQPYQAHFGSVMPCPDVASVLAQFENRNRILLLVYPPPDDDLAVDALLAYTGLGPSHDMLVYVGEGRGGANANDAFFNVLEDPNAGWVLLDMLPGVPCGTKGEEKVYIFQRRRQ